MSDINRDEWLSALNEADKVRDEPTAVTVVELMEIWKLRHSAARARISEMVEKGHAIRVRVRRNGRVLPAYKLVKAIEKGKRKVDA